MNYVIRVWVRLPETEWKRLTISGFDTEEETRRFLTVFQGSLGLYNQAAVIKPTVEKTNEYTQVEDIRSSCCGSSVHREARFGGKEYRLYCDNPVCKKLVVLTGYRVTSSGIIKIDETERSA